jgi:hypothetical protein
LKLTKFISVVGDLNSRLPYAQVAVERMFDATL